MRNLGLACTGVFLLLAYGIVGAQSESPEPARRNAKLKTVAVERGALRVTLERKGTFIPAGAVQVALETEAARGPFRITRIVPHGSMVRKGDVILALDARAVQEQIEQAEFDLNLKKLTLRRAEADMDLSRARAADTAERAEWDAKQAAKRLDGWRKHEQAHQEEQKRLDRAGWAHRLEDMTDELEQLKKMYGEDELVDATEKIVVKRAERRFKTTKARSDLSEARRRYREEYGWDYKEPELEMSARHKRRSLERLLKTNKLNAERSAAGLRKSNFDLARSARYVARLKRDLARLTVRAPADGLLLHGEAEAAPWTARLKLRGVVAPHRILFTIASPTRLSVLSNLPEKDVLRVGSVAKTVVSPSADKEIQWPGVARVAYLPDPKGAYRVDVELDSKKAPKNKALRPGMHCTLKLTVKEIADALLLPKSAVKSDKKGRYVRLFENGVAARRAVKVGETDGKKVQILSGLKEGDRVVP